MPIGDLAQKRKMLDSLFGASHSSAMASSHTVALFTDSPYDGGTETDYPGYARVTFTNNSGWPAADTDATKTREATFPDATDEATEDIAAWVLFDGTDITLWEFLDEPIAVGGAGSLEPIGVTVYVPDDANIDT